MNNDEITKMKIWQVIGASSVGTMLEWYDFYIFGSLAVTTAHARTSDVGRSRRKCAPDRRICRGLVETARAVISASSA